MTHQALVPSSLARLIAPSISLKHQVLILKCAALSFKYALPFLKSIALGVYFALVLAVV
jgi:hypothetical protein